jgi:hypothetical protein
VLAGERIIIKMDPRVAEWENVHQIHVAQIAVAVFLETIMMFRFHKIHGIS